MMARHRCWNCETASPGRHSDYLKPWSGGVVLGIGSAAVEGYNLFTYFASPVKSERATAEIAVDVQGMTPHEAETNKLFDHLGLPVRIGMQKDEAKEVLKGAEIVKDIPTYSCVIRGRRWPYYVDCHINKRKGLFRVWMARKDLVDKQIALES